MRAVLVTPRFERKLVDFINCHPELDILVESVMDAIASDKTDTIRKHPLKGILKGCHAARISYEYRIVFVLEKGQVCFIDIGTHDEVYR